FSHVAECFDPATGEKVEDDNPQTIWGKSVAAHAGRSVIIAFKVTKPANLTWVEILTSLKNQGYVRVLVGGAVHKIDNFLPHAKLLAKTTELFVAQDRLAIEAAQKSRCLEAVETALHFGHGQVHVFAADSLTELGHFSRGLHSPKTRR